MLISGPPELPGFTAASVDERKQLAGLAPLGTDDAAVTVFCNRTESRSQSPTPRPSAWPDRRSAEGSAVPSILTIATSLRWSEPPDGP